MPNLHVVHAFDGVEAGVPGVATIRRVFDRGARFDTGEVQRADVGDVVGGIAAGVGSQRNTRSPSRRIEREAERRGRRRIARDIDLSDLNVVQSFDGAEARVPMRAVVDAVLNGGAGFDASDVQRTDIGDVVSGAAAGIGRERDTGRGGRGVEREAER
ncbi:hypothetical protein, partial [Burkholderia ambifaria]|uniref:hypothetical protein n=1 Tax=Burkholderia ambifaria TaxID=152480 RepID=UPI003C7A9989